MQERHRYEIGVEIERETDSNKRSAENKNYRMYIPEPTNRISMKLHHHREGEQHPCDGETPDR